MALLGRAVIVLSARPGNRGGDGAPSHIPQVVFWLDAPVELQQPVTAVLVDGRHLRSYQPTRVQDATDDEKAALAGGKVLEFLLDDAGQISHAETADGLAEHLMGFYRQLADSLAEQAAREAPLAKSVIGIAIGKAIDPDGKWVGKTPIADAKMLDDLAALAVQKDEEARAEEQRRADEKTIGAEPLGIASADAVIAIKG